MTRHGWIFMAVSWALIVGVTAFAFWRTLRNRK
jgi:ABC-type nickel/cobalt efflux system permease component RcnA